MRSRQDISKKFVCNLTGGYKLYHVINCAGSEFSTVNDRNGQLFSCYRDEEQEMLKRLGIKKIEKEGE